MNNDEKLVKHVINSSTMHSSYRPVRQQHAILTFDSHCFLFFYFADDNPQLKSDEHRLFRKLMKNYEKSVRPVINSSTTVVVRLGITLTQIFDMDERNQVLTVNVWLDQVSETRCSPSMCGWTECNQVLTVNVWLEQVHATRC